MSYLRTSYEPRQELTKHDFFITADIPADNRPRDYLSGGRRVWCCAGTAGDKEEY